MTHTQPTVSYGHGWLFDGDRTSGDVEGAWTGTNCTLSADEGDYFAVTYTAATAVATHATSLNKSTTLYPKLRCRYKCSNANVKAKIITVFSGDETGTSTGSGSTTSVLSSDRTEANDTWNGYYLTFTSGVNAGLCRLISDFEVSGGPAVGTFTVAAFPETYTADDTFTLSTVANTQTVLADTNSTTLTVASASLTASKTIDYVFMYATTAAGTVYYDFMLIYKGDFTIPNCIGGIDWMPTPRYAQLPIPGMIGAHTQNLGSDAAEWHLTGDLTNGTWTRSGGSDHLLGEVFLDIAHNSATEPWQWFDSKLGACKVTLDTPIFHRAATNNELDWTVSLVFREYRLSSAGCSHESYGSRFHLEMI